MIHIKKNKVTLVLFLIGLFFTRKGFPMFQGYGEVLKLQAVSSQEEEKIDDVVDFFSMATDIANGNNGFEAIVKLVDKHQDKIEAVAKGAVKLGSEAVEVAREVFKTKKERIEREINAIDRHLGVRGISLSEKETLEKRKFRFEKELENLEDESREMTKQISDLAFGNLNKALNGWIDEKVKRKDREQQRQYDVLKTKISVQEKIKGLTSKETLTRGGITLVATLTGILASYYSGKLAFNYLDAKIGKPLLVRESSRSSFKDSFLNLFKTKKNVSAFDIDEVILESKTRDILYNFANEVSSAYQNGLPFRNILFYGLPGTGKTMFAKSLAQHCGMDYAVMSGADFSQFKNGQDIVELHKLFDWSENSKRGLLVFIDEADSFLRDRRVLSNEEKNLLNAFLSRTGEASKKVIFVFATNYENELDPAVLSRIHKKVEFVLPGIEERIKILNMYIEKYIINDKRTILQDGKKVEMFIEIVEDVNSDFIKEIASKMNGFSGRDIEQLTAELRVLAYSKGDGILSRDIINAAIEDKIKEYKHDLKISNMQKMRYEKDLGF